MSDQPLPSTPPPESPPETGEAVTPQGEEPKPSRRRGRPPKQRAVEPDANGKEPRFEPKVTSMHTNAIRRISTAQYESVELMCHAEFVPDPNFTNQQNMAKMTNLMAWQVEEIAKKVRAEIRVGR